MYSHEEGIVVVSTTCMDSETKCMKSRKFPQPFFQGQTLLQVGDSVGISQPTLHMYCNPTMTSHACDAHILYLLVNVFF